MKKDFKSQADVLLGKTSVPEIKPTKEKEIEQEKISLAVKETKSKKVLIAIKPSLYEGLKKQAKLNKLSLNETIGQLLEMVLKQQ